MSPKRPAAREQSSGFAAVDIDRLFKPLERFRHLALAVSGGADSIALMLMAAGWRGPVQFTVLTVDHGLRAASGREARAVVGWAHALGLKARRLAWSGDKPKTGVQSKAREARYRLMAQWCAAHDAEGVVTAHTLDDQAETFLMRLARGSGIDGLSAMAAETVVHGVRVLRPLIGIRRVALRRLVESRAHGFFDDPSNEDPAFERVRVRRAREALAKAGVSFDHLAAAAKRIGRAREALERSTDGLEQASVHFAAEGHATLMLEPFLAAPDELRVRLLARLFARLGGASARPRLSEIERFDAWLAAREGQARTLGGCRAKRRGDRLIIGRESGRMAKSAITIRPGETQLFDERFKVRLHGGRGMRMALVPLGQAKRAEDVKRPKNLPEFVFRTLPALVRDGEIALVPHIGYRRPDLGGSARAEVAPVAAPHNSLTIQ